MNFSRRVWIGLNLLHVDSRFNRNLLSVIYFFTTRAHTQKKGKKPRNFRGYVFIWTEITNSYFAWSLLADLLALYHRPHFSMNLSKCLLIAEHFFEGFSRTLIFNSFPLGIVSGSLQNTKRFINVQHTEIFWDLFQHYILHDLFNVNISKSKFFLQSRYFMKVFFHFT